MEERLVDVGPPLVAHRKPAVAGEPSKRALYDPPVQAELLARVHPAAGDAPLDGAPSERLPAARGVVALVGVQLIWALAWPAWLARRVPDRLDGVYHIPEDLRVVDVCGAEHYGERDALPVGNKMALGARFAAIRRILSDLLAPLLAATLAESSEALDQRSCRPPPACPARLGATGATHPPPASRAASASTSNRTRSPSPWGASPRVCPS